jgi:peptide/nickel transport system permease protein
MLRYTLVRFGQGLIVLLAVVTIVFLLARASGNAAEIMAPPDAGPEAVEEMKRNLGLDKPLIVQYGSYLGDLVQGDLGQSFSYRAPVSELVMTALPNSITLGLFAFLFAATFGVSIGVLSALRPGSWFDRIGKGIALLGQSVPSFWLGMLLVLMFAVQVQAFPPYGSGSFRHVVLPAIALGAFPLASLTRLTRSSVIEVQRKDHTLFERAKGVSVPTMLLHVLRNASLPVVTLAGIQLGALISGTVVIETLFAWPGAGALAIQAVQSRDYNVIQGVVLVNTAIFVGLLFLVDISYGVLDPRVRRQARGVATSS